MQRYVKNIKLKPSCFKVYEKAIRTYILRHPENLRAPCDSDILEVIFEVYVYGESRENKSIKDGTSNVGAAGNIKSTE